MTIFSLLNRNWENNSRHQDRSRDLNSNPNFSIWIKRASKIVMKGLTISSMLDPISNSAIQLLNWFSKIMVHSLQMTKQICGVSKPRILCFKSIMLQCLRLVEVLNLEMCNRMLINILMIELRCHSFLSKLILKTIHTCLTSNYLTLIYKVKTNQVPQTFMVSKIIPIRAYKRCRKRC